jgi:hypothetical protein
VVFVLCLFFIDIPFSYLLVGYGLDHKKNVNLSAVVFMAESLPKELTCIIHINAFHILFSFV